MAAELAVRQILCCAMKPAWQAGRQKCAVQPNAVTVAPQGNKPRQCSASRAYSCNLLQGELWNGRKTKKTKQKIYQIPPVLCISSCHCVLFAQTIYLTHSYLWMWEKKQHPGICCPNVSPNNTKICCTFLCLWPRAKLYHGWAVVLCIPCHLLKCHNPASSQGQETEGRRLLFSTEGCWWRQQPKGRSALQKALSLSLHREPPECSRQKRWGIAAQWNRIDSNLPAEHSASWSEVMEEQREGTPLAPIPPWAL